MARLTIVMDAIRDALASRKSSPVYGVRRDTEDLTQALSAEPAAMLEEVATVHREHPAGHCYEVPLGSSGIAWLAPGVPLAGTPEIEFVELADGLESRRTDGGALRAGTLAVFGLGGLGGPITVLSAQAGVGTITLIDKDRIEASNLNRHPCDSLDLGRLKVDAVGDVVRRRGTTAIPIPADVASFTEADLDAICGTADAVVAAMDSPQEQFRVNEACVRAGIPLAAPAVYERACGGEVVCVQPGRSPCLYCSVGFRTGLAPAIAVGARRQAYQAADANRLVAEPGLAADIALIAAVATAYVLAILDPTGSRAALLDPSKAFVLVHGGSTPRPPYSDLFQAPFDLLYAHVTRDDPCPVCGWTTRR